jgi:hypothetical protein
MALDYGLSLEGVVGSKGNNKRGMLVYNGRTLMNAVFIRLRDYVHAQLGQTSMASASNGDVDVVCGVSTQGGHLDGSQIEFVMMSDKDGEGATFGVSKHSGR